MKTEDIQRYFVVFCVTVAGVLAGVYCGQLAGNGNQKQLGEIFACIVAAVIFIKLGKSCWLLIPITLQLNAKSHLLPLPFSVNEVCVILVFAAYIVLNAMKAVPKRSRSTFLDFIVLLNLLYLLSAYIRNPVGLKVFGSDLIGGRPYYIVIISVLAYWVFGRAAMNPRQARIILIGSFVCALIIVALTLVTHYIPASAPIVSHIYEGVDSSTFREGDENFQSEADTNDDARVQPLAGFGMTTISLLCALYPATTLLVPLHFWRFLLFVFSILAISKSGHRVAVISATFTIFVTTYFHRRFGGVFKLLVFLLPLLAILIIGNGTVFTLPYTAQRALSFLPGKWDSAAMQDAHGSTDWRIDMWKRALEGNRYIKNKVLGDGFGFSSATSDAVQESAYRGDPEAGKEGLMIAGDFHSGPVSAIRFVGVVGLVLFYIFQIYLAFYAYKLIWRSKGTPYFAISLYFAAGMITWPLLFTFVFGAYQGDLPSLIVDAGLLKLINQAVEDYQKEKQVLNPGRNINGDGRLRQQAGDVSHAASGV